MRLMIVILMMLLVACINGKHVHDNRLEGLFDSINSSKEEPYYSDLKSYYDSSLEKRISLDNSNKVYLVNSRNDTIVVLHKYKDYYITSIKLEYGNDAEPELTYFYKLDNNSGLYKYSGYQLFPNIDTRGEEILIRELKDPSNSLYVRKKALFQLGYVSLNLPSIIPKLDSLSKDQKNYDDKLLEEMRYFIGLNLLKEVEVQGK